MEITNCELVSLGSTTEKAIELFNKLQLDFAAEISFYKDIDEFLSLPDSINAQIVVVEKLEGSRELITGLRESKRNFIIYWIGADFEKEDYQFALENRVYSVCEHFDGAETEIGEAFQKIYETLDEEKKFKLVVRSLKSILLQINGDIAEPVFHEVKAAVAKIDSYGQSNELQRGRANARTADQWEHLFHKQESLEDVLMTIDSLERTGVLIVQSDDKEGHILFQHGKVVQAYVGEVVSLKAVFRMFLWDNATFTFSRRELSDSEIEDAEPIHLTTKHIRDLGAGYRGRYQKIKSELPPGDLHLKMNPEHFNLEANLSGSAFGTLSSIVEFSTVSQVLDYNLLPDVVIYENLIELRRSKLIKVA